MPYKALFSLPNLLTCANLACGVLAIVLLQNPENELYIASWLVVLACVFDFFDGFAARLLKQNSAIGKDLDSLADMVSFGVLPAIILYQLCLQNQTSQSSFVPYLCLLIPIFSALRLAKFNNDPRQADGFLGVPTPTNALLIASLPCMLHYQPLHFFTKMFTNQNFLTVLMVLMPIALISELPLFALKFKNFSWSSNQKPFILLLSSAAMLVGLGVVAVPFIIMLYVLISIFNQYIFTPKQ